MGALAVLVVALIIVLVVIVVDGDGSDGSSYGAAAASERGGAVDPEYLRSARPVIDRLSDSAEVSGRTLSAASRPRDVGRVVRMARQQLALVQDARSRLSSLTVPPASRVASGNLTRATQAHRRYLITLSRIGGIRTERALRGLATAQRQARRAVDAYRAFGRAVPGSTGRILAAEITDLSGVREALLARRAAERRAAEEAAEDGATPASAPSAGDSSRGRPEISSVTAFDGGSTIDIQAQYCDRTPGAVNQFVYTFRILDGGVAIATDSYSAAQTRACNSISWSFSDTFPIRGGYTVQVTVDNLTNGVSASATTALTVVN